MTGRLDPDLPSRCKIEVAALDTTADDSTKRHVREPRVNLRRQQHQPSRIHHLHPVRRRRIQ